MGSIGAICAAASKAQPRRAGAFVIRASASAEARFTGLTETAILPTNHKKVLALA